MNFKKFVSIGLVGVCLLGITSIETYAGSSSNLTSFKNLAKEQTSIVISSLVDDDYIAWVGNYRIRVGDSLSKFNFKEGTYTVRRSSQSNNSSFTYNILDFGDYLICVSNRDSIDGTEFYIDSIEFKSDKYFTSRGISLGETLEDVKQVYGTGISGCVGNAEARLLFYKHGGHQLMFQEQDGKINKIVYSKAIISADTDNTKIDTYSENLEDNNYEDLFSSNEELQNHLDTVSENSISDNSLDLAEEEEDLDIIYKSISSPLSCIDNIYTFGNDTMGTFQINKDLIDNYTIYKNYIDDDTIELNEYGELVATEPLQRTYIVYGNAVNNGGSHEPIFSLTLLSITDIDNNYKSYIPKVGSMLSISDNNEDLDYSDESVLFSLDSGIEGGYYKYIANNDDTMSGIDLVFQITDTTMTHIYLECEDKSIVENDSILSSILDSFIYAIPTQE